MAKRNTNTAAPKVTSVATEVNIDSVTVYQVRAIEQGRTRIVHAYATNEEAEDAIVTMKLHSNSRYVIVPVPNDSSQYWGI